MQISNMLQLKSAPVSNHILTKNQLVRILSIDGGGIRGIIPAAIVAYLEER